MKTKSILLAATLAAFAATTVYAADDAMTKKDESPKAAKAEAKKPAKKHSHAAEKGTPAAESKTGKSHRETMDKDMPMHDHTQDRH
jgi:opacity protein-like surface antigen